MEIILQILIARPELTQSDWGDWGVESSLRIASCELRAANCELRIASCRLRAANCKLRSEGLRAKS